MPWGTDDGGHFYISPVEGKVIAKDLEERRIQKAQKAVQVYRQSDDNSRIDSIKEQFCRTAVLVEELKDKQRHSNPCSDKAKGIVMKVNKHQAEYYALLRQLQAIYAGEPLQDEQTVDDKKPVITKQEKAKMRDSIVAELLFRIVEQVIPERKDDLIAVVNDILDKELKERGVADG